MSVTARYRQEKEHVKIHCQERQGHVRCEGAGARRLLQSMIESMIVHSAQRTVLGEISLHRDLIP